MATDYRFSQLTVDQLTDAAAALDARLSQLVVDQLTDDDHQPVEFRSSQVVVDQLTEDDHQPVQVHLSQVVVDYFITPVSQCHGGGAITVFGDPPPGEDFNAQNPDGRTWLVIGFDA